MASTYTSGRPRVHATAQKKEIEATLDEYAAFCRENPDDELSAQLARTVVDLEEELELRRREHVPGIPDRE